MVHWGIFYLDNASYIFQQTFFYIGPCFRIALIQRLLLTFGILMFLSHFSTELFLSVQAHVFIAPYNGSSWYSVFWSLNLHFSKNPSKLFGGTIGISLKGISLSVPLKRTIVLMPMQMIYIYKPSVPITSFMKRLLTKIEKNRQWTEPWRTPLETGRMPLYKSSCRRWSLFLILFSESLKYIINIVHYIFHSVHWNKKIEL